MEAVFAGANPYEEPAFMLGREPSRGRKVVDEEGAGTALRQYLPNRAANPTLRIDAPESKQPSDRPPGLAIPMRRLTECDSGRDQLQHLPVTEVS